MTRSVPTRRVPLAKIIGYLLDPAHPIGGPKAAFFQGFGFSAENWPTFDAALMEHPDRNPVDAVRIDRWGTRYAVRCSVRTPDGRNPCIVSVWIVPPNREDALLVTAYPADESIGPKGGCRPSEKADATTRTDSIVLDTISRTML